MAGNNKDSNKSENQKTNNVSRREFVKTAAIATSVLPFVGGAISESASALTAIAQSANAAGTEEIKVGLIGCGGRGTGAAIQSMEASKLTRIVAVADLFEDRLTSSLNYIKEQNPEQARIADDRCYVGFNAYKELINSDVDLVILATPPHFRPIHLEYAIQKGKHVFMEKPVAVDPTGIRQVMAAGEMAKKMGLGIVAGTQRRHENCYLDAIKQLEKGAIGEVIAAQCYWNQQGLWNKDPLPEWSDMEWQIRNWLYFTWLSGDHIVEQHVHNLDAVNWVMGSHPIRCLGLGGREVRKDPKYGHIFDHFAVEYEYPNGAFASSMCRQINGCASRVEERIHGTKGKMFLSSGRAAITGENPWTFDPAHKNQPYTQEHVDLIESIISGNPLNEAQRIAESTLTAIMGRMSTYTGQEVSWEQAINSKLDLRPPAYEFGDLPFPEVAVPGKTPLI